ncbi:MAG TPA: transcriptional regulator [Parvularcula sp.]|nr:transcriptional regulator [Parvularcula sp.]
MTTIGDVSALTGVNIETIRYYERIGLVPKPPRTEGGRRAYADADAKRLRFIRRARDLGFSIDDIRALLQLADSGGACKGAQEIAVRHRDDVRDKIKTLKRLDRILTDAAVQCGRAERGCPIIDTLVEGALR